MVWSGKSAEQCGKVWIGADGIGWGFPLHLDFYGTDGFGEHGNG